MVQYHPSARRSGDQCGSDRITLVWEANREQVHCAPLPSLPRSRSFFPCFFPCFFPAPDYLFQSILPPPSLGKSSDANTSVRPPVDGRVDIAVSYPLAPPFFWKGGSLYPPKRGGCSIGSVHLLLFSSDVCLFPILQIRIVFDHPISCGLPVVESGVSSRAPGCATAPSFVSFISSPLFSKSRTTCLLQLWHSP